MHWDRLFEDLEGQLASEWEAERAALDAEAARLRIAKIELRTRLAVLRSRQADIIVDLHSDESLRGKITALGADWIALLSGRRLRLVPLRKITGFRVDHGLLLDSLDADEEQGLQERMTLGFVSRDLARRRTPVTIGVETGVVWHGTIDRAGSDHLDLAVHDAGEPRRANAVRSFHLIPFTAILWLDVGAAQL